jgi:ABC-type branched-subunit amino acid transport system substrate-binding protein
MLNQGLLNRDVMIISISDQIGTSLIAEKVYYVGYDTEKMNIFEDLYKSRYKAKPTVFSAMGYDAMGVVSTMLLQGKFSYNGLHDSSGFIGVMGDFKFTNSRIVERSYTVYKAQGVKIEKVI